MSTVTLIPPASVRPADGGSPPEGPSSGGPGASSDGSGASSS